MTQKQQILTFNNQGPANARLDKRLNWLSKQLQSNLLSVDSWINQLECDYCTKVMSNNEVCLSVVEINERPIEILLKIPVDCDTGVIFLFHFSAVTMRDDAWNERQCLMSYLLRIKNYHRLKYVDKMLNYCQLQINEKKPGRFIWCFLFLPSRCTKVRITNWLLSNLTDTTFITFNQKES